MTSQCFLCPLPGRFRCPQCGLVLFCSERHGELHCLTPGADCHPVTVRGGGLVAARSVREGEILLRERPAVLAPSGELEERGRCLVCLTSLDTESCLLCEGCGFPLCEECEDEDSHQQDCHQLAGWAAASYTPLPPHRLLQLRQSQPGLYHGILSLARPQVVGEPELGLVEGLELQHQVTREEVRAVLAVLEAHSVPLAPGLTGLYYLRSLLAVRQDHNCRLLPSKHPSHLLSVQATRQSNTQINRQQIRLKTPIIESVVARSELICEPECLTVAGISRQERS